MGKCSFNVSDILSQFILSYVFDLFIKASFYSINFVIFVGKLTVSFF